MKAIISTLSNWLHQLAVVITAPAIPLPPHCCNISGLLMHMCDGDRDLHRWVLRWLALPLRQPGAKMATCLAFNGSDTRSMELLVEIVITSLYGHRAREITADDLLHIVNPWASGARLVVVQGGVFNRVPLNQLKALVGGSHVWINERSKPERAEANEANYIYLSSLADFLPVSVSSRRFTLIETPPAPGARFHRAVIDEIENGGIEAFRQYLLKDLDMAEFNTTTRPPTSSSSTPPITPARAA